ncbi:MAG: FeoA family protein [Anaerolineales bacterium]|nr:ferrous iron transport protein A [Anaerolineales bacterium]MCS7248360.1 ferrous iron transport protein A [Anaerolineales bacterium]MDW8162173.1 FeoA family protein [Anaerolineales bacterium]MDW8446728.1 FeoA family protein [Anaerolineales bacterium]
MVTSSPKSWLFKRNRPGREPPSGALLPLSELASGERATFVELRGGRGVKGRLTALGFTPGVAILMVQNYGWGPLIVEVRDTRVALGRHEAEHILVRRS